MVHIILTILKIIGWILLAVLGVIVLLSCVMLFTPLRYEIRAKCDGRLSTLEGGVKFSYFLHLISGSVRYADKKLVWKLRIAWKKLGSEKEAAEAVKETADEVGDVFETGLEIADEAGDVFETGLKAVDEAEGRADEAGFLETEESEENPDMKTESADGMSAGNLDISDSKSESAADLKSENVTGTIREDSIPKENEREPEIQQKTDRQENIKKENARRKNAWQEKAPKENLSDRLDHFFEKISCKSEAICGKIKELIRKKEIVMDFLTNEIHKAAFMKVISEIKRLLGRLKPQRINGNLEFGFEDPALTGKVLAGLSILYPYTGDNLQVTPQFEDKILKGDIYIKGSAAAKLFASMGLRLLLNKNIRTTIKHARKFKLD